MTLWIPVIVVLIANFVGGIGALFLKLGSGHSGMKKFLNKKVIFGFFLYGMGTIVFIIALKYGELSVLYSLSATAYVWVAVFSKYFLGEKMNTGKIVGILGIVLGVVLITVF